PSNAVPTEAALANLQMPTTGIQGIPSATPGEKLVAVQRLVSPAYFRTMGICLARGRFFTGRDNTNAAPVVIINEALARRYFPGRDAVGKRMGSPDFGPQPCEIVGVINDVRQASLDATPEPEVFRPLLQECFSGITVVA